MLTQEQSFAKTDGETGSIKEFSLEIKVSDEKPVQKHFSSFPRPLYPKVKAYIQDLVKHSFKA